MRTRPGRGRDPFSASISARPRWRRGISTFTTSFWARISRTMTRKKNTMNLSLVVLNYNSEAFLERCLRSVREFHAGGFPEIVVVDNGSRGLAALRRGLCPHAGGCPEIVVVDNGSRDLAALRRVCSEFGVDRVLENRLNAGVAAGRNQGVRASSGEIVCTLDVDTVITAGALDTLRYAAQGPAAGVCGPQLRFPDGELQLTCRRFPTIHTKLLRLKPRLDVFRALDYEEMRDLDHSRPAAVDWVIGACQCYPRAVFDELGGYTVFSRFGSEDIDFCLRAWMSGKQVQYVPAAVIYHHEQRVARSLARGLSYSHLASLAKFFAAHRYGFRREPLYRRIAERNPYFGRLPLMPAAVSADRSV